ncbi:hypothetical protein [Candidatus Regiella insecticola]|nr:hypothetical protein [Candidatus Regiella insecticola]
MSVDILPDSANTRSQRRRNLKGKGYTRRRRSARCVFIKVCHG